VSLALVLIDGIREVAAGYALAAGLLADFSMERTPARKCTT
jgi:hypothetical protein